MKYSSYIFVALLLALYFILDFHNILFFRPQGIHFIRQSDSLSFVANYYKNGFHFFEPQVFNLQSTDGKAACEFPILYYITALLYLIFNEHEFILRLLTLSIASAGFLYLFKLILLLLKDVVYAFAFTFLFISSTVLLYYSNNFLPDPSALGFTLIGWYCFFNFFKNGKNKKSLLLCFIFFSLAALLKVTYFINPVAAILSVFTYEFFRKKGFKKGVIKNIFPLILFASSLTLIFLWNAYVLYYNQINHDNYFLVHALPLWDLSKNESAVVWDHILNFWYSKYYYQSTFHVFAMIIIAGIFFIRKSEKLILIPALFLAAGSTCYFVLFFAAFKYHDYYFITLMPSIIFIIISTFVAIKNKFPKWSNHYAAKSLVILLCVLSLNYAKEKLVQRYINNEDLHSSIGTKLADSRKFIDSLVPENAKVIIVTDQTPNGALYFINRSGWNIRDTSEKSKADIATYISQGAQYILYTDKKYIDDSFEGKKIGEEKGIVLYKL